MAEKRPCLLSLRDQLHLTDSAAERLRKLEPPELDFPQRHLGVKPLRGRAPHRSPP